MLNTVTVDILGTQVRVTQLPLAKSRPLFFKLMKVCGPGVVKFLSALDSKTQLQNVAMPVIADALGELVNSLDYPTFDLFVKEFATGSVILEPGGNEHGRAMTAAIETDAF